MGLIFMIFLSLLELTAVVFNLRMLLSCFKDKTKYPFLQRGRMFFICQWICQVTILVADAVESWKGFGSQLKESCNIFRVLSLSLMFFQAYNLMAIVIILSESQVKGENREFSTKLKISAVLVLGLTGSATISWYNCFSPQNLSRMFLKAILFASAIFVILIVSAAARNISIEDTPTDETQPEASVWKIFPKKRYLFLVTLLIMCLIIILSWEPHSESSRNSYKPEDFEEVIVLKEVAYSVVETFFVGIVLPVILTNLIDSNYEEKDEIKTIII